MSSIRTLTTIIRRETFLEVIRALADAGAVYTHIDIRSCHCTIVLPVSVEMIELVGDVPRKLYRTTSGHVFAWVDAYEGEQEVFQLSSQRAWELNQP